MGKLAPQRQREHFVPTLETPARTRAMPIGRNDEAERTHEECFEKYRMRRITPQRYYFISVLPTFFRSAFSSLATRKIDASSPPSVATAKGRNSILWTSFKNKPTFCKNTTTFFTFSTGLKQEIITRRNNIRQKVKFLAHFVPHARITRTSTVFRFLPSLLHTPRYQFIFQHFRCEEKGRFCLHIGFTAKQDVSNHFYVIFYMKKKAKLRSAFLR